MDKKLTFHYDAGHGWLEVDASELERLGIAGQISGYSYKRGSRAYLEEDCDVLLYIETASRAGLIKKSDFHDVYDGDYSPIRDYDRYR